jgi:hypothetical protein
MVANLSDWQAPLKPRGATWVFDSNTGVTEQDLVVGVAGQYIILLGLAVAHTLAAVNNISVFLGTGNQTSAAYAFNTVYPADGGLGYFNMIGCERIGARGDGLHWRRITGGACTVFVNAAYVLVE